MEPHPFGEVAQDLGLASASDMESALQRQISLRDTWADSRVGEILVLMGVLDGLQVDRVLSEQRKRRSSNTSSRAFQYYRDYLILKKLGEGGMGEVFLANEHIADRLVVLKMLRKDRAECKSVADRFALEARIAGALSHPNIVTYHNTGFAHGVRFLVMEYVEGETLQDRIGRHGKIPEHEALGIAREVLKGMIYLHGKGIVHRDIKPANILIGEDESVKISDFGSARLQSHPFTENHTIVGTPNYMPPEQIRAEPSIDHRADLYSLGVTLYHALAGRLPFEYPSSGAIMKAHVHEEPEPLSNASPSLSAETIRIVEKMMSKDRLLRYPTAREALDDIEKSLEQVQTKVELPIREFAARLRPYKRHQVAAAGLGAIAWIGVALVLAAWFCIRT